MLNRTLKNREIEVHCLGKEIDPSQLNLFQNKDKVSQACQSGCPNYGMKWSCPPHSLSYDSLYYKYVKGLLLCFSVDMAAYCDISNKYLAIKAANVTIKTLIEKVARSVENEVNGYSLLSGSCRLCKPCNCKVGGKCKNPNKMRYSMEATYLNVDQISKKFLNHELLWYQDKKLPMHTSVLSLVLTNNDIDLKRVCNIISDNVKNNID